MEINNKAKEIIGELIENYVIALIPMYNLVFHNKQIKFKEKEALREILTDIDKLQEQLVRECTHKNTIELQSNEVYFL